MNAKSANGTDGLALRLAELSIRRPWWVIAAVLLLTIAAASGARFLEFSNNYRVFFSEKNPELIAFDDFQDTYTKNDNFLFVIAPTDGEVFSPRAAEGIEWLTEEAWQIPYALRVDSISNFQHTEADGDDLIIEDLIRDGGSLDAATLAKKKAIALAEPLLNNKLISPTADATGVNVTLQFPQQSLSEVPEAMAHVRELKREFRERYPELEVGVTGIAAMNNAFSESGAKDSRTLMPLMFGMLILFMFLALRSIVSTLSTMTVVVLSTASALGLAGHLGIQLTPISVTAPVIILTLAIADSIHILISILTLMRSGVSKRDALRESLRLNFQPVVITSVTTIVGFLALNFSDAPPFWDLGNITAMGIAAALLYSLTLLPALLTVMPVRTRVRDQTRTAAFHHRLGDLGEWVTEHYKPILLVLGTATIAAVLLLPTIELNDEWVKYFDYRTEFRRDAEYALEHFGLYTIEFSVPAGEAEGISDPAYLERLDAFTHWLRDQPEIVHVYSYTDIIRRLNKNMHGDDESYYRLPEDRRLAAQYLLLYELSLRQGLDLNDRISIDKSATRLTVTAEEISTAETRVLLDRTEEWIATHLPPEMATRPTSASVMFSHISERNIQSMLRGNALAVVLIAAIMILALRSFSIGLMSLIPNALPILVAFGIWALLVGQIGMASATVSASSLGIVVDDTVHFLAKYLRARREKNYSRPQAIRYAFEMVGSAIIATTIILTAGFTVLAFSTFRINRELGMLTAIVIVTALIIDFLLLPALLMIGHRQSPETRRAESTEQGVEEESRVPKTVHA